MDADPPTAQAPQPDEGPGRSRPWTPAAAREPVPPLAPPPARPGAGSPVDTVARSESAPARPHTLLVVLAGVLVIATAVILLLILGH